MDDVQNLRRRPVACDLFGSGSPPISEDFWMHADWYKTTCDTDCIWLSLHSGFNLGSFIYRFLQWYQCNPTTKYRHAGSPATLRMDLIGFSLALIVVRKVSWIRTKRALLGPESTPNSKNKERNFGERDLSFLQDYCMASILVAPWFLGWAYSKKSLCSHSFEVCGAPRIQEPKQTKSAATFCTWVVYAVWTQTSPSTPSTSLEVLAFLNSADAAEHPVRAVHQMALVAAEAADSMEGGEFCLELLQNLDINDWCVLASRINSS